MGQTILTSKQLDFLECVSDEKQITKRFYLTGGTALTEFYLRHRLSEDIDLYCIMTVQKDYSLKKLILDAKAKFDWDIDRLNLASQFIRAKEFRLEYPKMLISFSYNKMEKFFLQQAQNLKKDILE